MDERDPHLPSAPVQLDPAVLRRVHELSDAWNVPRSSVDQAACALLVHGWCAEDSEGVLDFPVSRRVRLESKTLPGMVSRDCSTGIERFPGSYSRRLLRACWHSNTRSVATPAVSGASPERKAYSRDPGQPTDRVNVNFIPSTFALDFGGVKASATYTSSGQVSGFGLFFAGVGDDLFLSTAGAGQPFSSFDVADLAERLQWVLMAMAADPRRRLSSIDPFGGGERAGLDAWGNRAVLRACRWFRCRFWRCSARRSRGLRARWR